LGEPGFPVAAAERRKRVIVSRDASFEVGDHDFTRMGIVPFVCLLIIVPEKTEDSFYYGKVFVTLKDAVFPQPLCSGDLQVDMINPILFLYCDGGPDHHPTYLSVQLSLTALFLKPDLDYLCVCCTAPFHSWEKFCRKDYVCC